MRVALGDGVAVAVHVGVLVGVRVGVGVLVGVRVGVGVAVTTLQPLTTNRPASTRTVQPLCAAAGDADSSVSRQKVKRAIALRFIRSPAITPRLFLPQLLLRFPLSVDEPIQIIPPHGELGCPAAAQTP